MPNETQQPNWQQRLKLKLACELAFVITWLLKKTLRIEIHQIENRLHAESIHPAGSFALATWHNNCLAGTIAHAGQEMALLISSSFDGELIAFCASRFKFDTIRGSSTRGGTKALKQCFRTIRQGCHVAITVDGPKGPRHEVKPGIIDISRRSGAPILPLATIASDYWTLKKSWDLFRIPKPFSRVHVIYGEPLLTSEFTGDNANELATEELKKRLLALEELLNKQATTMSLNEHTAH